MGFTTTEYAMMAMAAGTTVSAIAASQQKAPNIAAPTPPPQAGKAPDVANTMQGMTGAGQAGGSPGVAQTFLTGSQGVDPSLLNLGKNTLLGS